MNDDNAWKTSNYSFLDPQKCAITFPLSLDVSQLKPVDGCDGGAQVLMDADGMLIFHLAHSKSDACRFIATPGWVRDKVKAGDTLRIEIDVGNGGTEFSINGVKVSEATENGN